MPSVCQYLLSSLDDQTLLALGVLDSNHRRAILHKASPMDIEQDFDNMLGDLSSVIKDLEMFSVVGLHSCVCVCVFETVA